MPQRPVILSVYRNTIKNVLITTKIKLQTIVGVEHMELLCLFKKHLSTMKMHLVLMEHLPKPTPTTKKMQQNLTEIQLNVMPTVPKAWKMPIVLDSKNLRTNDNQ